MSGTPFSAASGTGNSTASAGKAPQHGGEGLRIPGLGGGHHREEEVVAVAAGAHVRLVQPAIELRAAGRGDPVDQPVRPDRLRLAFGFDRAVDETIRRVGQLG
jgi:hypothetical protein